MIVQIPIRPRRNQPSTLTYHPKMASSIAASAQGVLLFHQTQARQKFMAATPRQPRGLEKASNIEARRESGVKSTSPSTQSLSRKTSNDEARYESAVESLSPSVRSFESDDASIDLQARRHAILVAKVQHTLRASATVLKPRKQRAWRASSLPDCLKIRPNADRIAEEQAAIDSDDDGESLTIMRQRMADGFARLQRSQDQLDEVVARMNQADETLAEHIEEDQIIREARCAREVADAEERLVITDMKASCERKKAEAERLGERIVAEVVPLSADGRAYCDLAEVRRCAAPRAKYQMVPDSSYPRF